MQATAREPNFPPRSKKMEAFNTSRSAGIQEIHAKHVKKKQPLHERRKNPVKIYAIDLHNKGKHKPSQKNEKQGAHKIKSNPEPNHRSYLQRRKKIEE